MTCPYKNGIDCYYYKHGGYPCAFNLQYDICSGEKEPVWCKACEYAMGFCGNLNMTDGTFAQFKCMNEKCTNFELLRIILMEVRK